MMRNPSNTTLRDSPKKYAWFTMQQAGLSDMSIVIPTLSRPRFVLRQFQYWGETDAQVIILDGAISPIEIPDRLQRSNIRYIHTGTRFNERLATAGQYVETKYCALLPDDEFFLPSGLRAAVERLDVDKSIIGCVGRNIYFFVDEGRFLVRDAYRDWLPFPAAKNTLSDRLNADLPPNKTHMSVYAVLRSREWKLLSEAAYSEWFSCGYTYERLWNLKRAALGRTEIIENLLWMRSMENPPVQTKDIPRSAGHDFVSWARNTQFSGEVSRYRDIARRVILAAGASQTEAEMFEERFFVGGVHRQATKEAKNRKKITYRIRGIVLRLSPNWVSRLVKRYLPNRVLKFTGWQGYDLDTMCASLIARGTHFERVELDRVAKLSLDLGRTIGLEAKSV